jgi:hypothetical protein
VTAFAIALCVLSGLSIAAGCAGCAWLLAGRVLRTRCSCGHSYGMHDRYSGRCGSKVNTAWWLHRTLGVKQLAACKCVREVTS